MKNNAKEVIKYNKEISEKLSPTFCAAKWKSVHLYLQLGQGHSCYHPPPENILEQSILENPAALHNTPEKIAQRKQMLNGEKPTGCNYCWAIEELSKDNISDRHLKNYEQAGGNILKSKEIFAEGLAADVIPETIEVAFSNKCNLKCVYCNPKASSSWAEEIKKFGTYSEIENNYQVNQAILSDESSYVHAFEKWWAQIDKELKAFRITGGEPLLHKQTYKFLDKIIENPRPDLILIINSNLSVPESLTQQLIEKINKIETMRACKKVRVHASLESVGAKAEYARYGLDYLLWKKNIRKILERTDAEISFMCTYNVFSVVGFVDFLQMFLSLKKEFSQKKKRIKIDIPHLVLPRMFHIGILPEQYQEHLIAAIKFMKENSSDEANDLFSSIEIAQLSRILSVWRATNISELELKKLRGDFYKFQLESDKRRGTNFLDTFPELKTFSELASKSNE